MVVAAAAEFVVSAGLGFAFAAEALPNFDLAFSVAFLEAVAAVVFAEVLCHLVQNHSGFVAFESAEAFEAYFGTEWPWEHLKLQQATRDLAPL